MAYHCGILAGKALKLAARKKLGIIVKLAPDIFVIKQEFLILL